MANDSYNKSNALSGAKLPLIIFLALSLVFCFLYSREGDTGILHSIQQTVNVAFSPASAAGNAVGQAVDSAEQQVTDAVATDQTLSELQAENAQLRQQLSEALEYKQQAEHLQELLHLTETYDIDGVVASVIGRSREAYNQTITINAGSNSGIQAGYTVSGGTGVVGQIVRVYENTSVVRLITDNQSGVAVMIQSNRKEGIVKGSLDGLLYLENVDSEVTVQVGDVLVTSGMGGSYVRGLIVGQVVKINEASGVSSRTIIVAPNDDATTIESVVVVKSMGSLGAAA